jgi:hypothetical protein
MENNLTKDSMMECHATDYGARHLFASTFNIKDNLK